MAAFQEQSGIDSHSSNMAHYPLPSRSPVSSPYPSPSSSISGSEAPNLCTASLGAQEFYHLQIFDRRSDGNKPGAPRQSPSTDDWSSDGGVPLPTEEVSELSSSTPLVSRSPWGSFSGVRVARPRDETPSSSEVPITRLNLSLLQSSLSSMTNGGADNSSEDRPNGAGASSEESSSTGYLTSETPSSGSLASSGLSSNCGSKSSGECAISLEELREIFRHFTGSGSWERSPPGPLSPVPSLTSEETALSTSLTLSTSGSSGLFAIGHLPRLPAGSEDELFFGGEPFIADHGDPIL